MDQRVRRQYRAATIAAALVAAVRGRRRIGLPPAAASACAFGVVPVIAAGFARSRGRDAAVWVAQMWAYKNAFEMPADREVRLRQPDPNPTEGDHEMGANAFAAMPSDHFASAAMTAILLAEQDPWLGALGWTYALGLAFALVYLGEHYVGDLIAGLALAVGLNAARRPLEHAANRLLALGPGG